MNWFWPLLMVGMMIPPTRLQVSSARGVAMITLRQDPQGGPMVPLAPLAKAIGGTVKISREWAVLSTSVGNFSFLVGTPLVSDGIQLRNLPAMAFNRRDTVFVPLAFVADVLADSARRAWRWSRAKTQLTEGTAVAFHHRVTLDPGHGGTDAGNPGIFFPKGMHEKDVTLAIGLLVRDELKKRGVEVAMTRTRDTLINLAHRAPRYCASNCDLFISLHVNSLERSSPDFGSARGFETYFLAQARTADAERVARMENAAVRYEPPTTQTNGFGDLGFTRRDLQTNEFLRQSAKAADMVQERLKTLHAGTDRGVKQANFAVLTTALSPAVLIEMGFSTNRADAQLLTSPAGQAELASSIADAILDYLTDLDKIMGRSGPPQ